MRLVSWNCYRGSVAERTARLAPLRPDIVALQECRAPDADVEGVYWQGGLEQQGVAIVADGVHVDLVSLPGQLPATVLPVLVHGPVPFLLVNVWTLPAPTYEQFAIEAAAACVASVGGMLPTVLIGDFNSSPAIGYQRKTGAEMLRRLRDEFGLVSAYHLHHAATPGQEPHPTLLHHWKEESRFHIDYCFIPETWTTKIRSVAVGNFEEWRDSDHRPLIVDLDL